MIKIIDNFYGDMVSNAIQKGMLSLDFPWFFCENIVSKSPTNNFQFTHVFYKEGEPKTDFYTDLVTLGVLKKLEIAALVKIKANFQSKTESIIKNPLHVDHSFPNCLTAIYYVNTNNGFTYFEDGKVVESVKDRMVIFSSNMLHGGTTCSDKKYRCVINFNFYPTYEV